MIMQVGNVCNSFLSLTRLSRLGSSAPGRDLIASLVHETEECVEVHLVVFAARDDLVYDCLQVLKDFDVGDVSLRHRIALRHASPLDPRVLLNVLWHVKETL